MSVTPFELVRIAAYAADEKKAEDIVVLGLEGVSDVSDYFMICTAGNPRLLDAVVDEVEEKIRVNAHLKPLSHEGRAGASWVLLDYGSVVIHVFLPETREYYRLERLWGDAPRIDVGLETHQEA